jgi:endo-alpha-1,4-polygalactosaminidase (GH114 family)
MTRLGAAVAAVLLSLVLSVSAVVAPSPAYASCSTAGCAPPVACNTGAGACWSPAVGVRWQYQLQGSHASQGCNYSSTGGINVNISAVPAAGGAAVRPDVFDIDFQTDGFCTGGTISQENTAAVAAIHANGAHVICYVDAGTAESFRPDYQDYVNFNAQTGGALFGKPVGGFRNEHWLNINNDRGQRDFILAKVGQRVDRCKAAGFDAVEFDNIDAYQNKTGLSISSDTQLLFNTALANLAHAKGLTVALKNDLGQANELRPWFDFAINEQCFQYRECDYPPPGLAGWTAAGKAVFNVEYKSLKCTQAASFSISSILKTVDLFDVPWMPCT